MNEPIRPTADVIREHAQAACASLKAAIIVARRSGNDTLAIELTRARDAIGRAVNVR